MGQEEDEKAQAQAKEDEAEGELDLGNRLQSIPRFCVSLPVVHNESSD